MGRKRHSHSELPKRVYAYHGALWYMPKGGKKIRLGGVSDLGAALMAYGKLVQRTVKLSTIGDVIDRYQREILPTKAPRTQEDYRAYCGKLKHAFGHMVPDEVETTDLYAYHERRGAPVRANREITVLGVIYRYAIRWAAATRNPVGGFLYEPETPRNREVKRAERIQFARQYCPRWLRVFIMLKYITGRRQAELLRLGLYSIKDEGLAVPIAKKRRQRTLILTWTPSLRRIVALVKALRRPAHSLLFFHGERGKPMNARALKSVWQRAMQRWEADGHERFWEHDIRAATSGAAQNDERARELLDHADVRTTRRSYRRAEETKVRPLR